MLWIGSTLVGGLCVIGSASAAIYGFVASEPPAWMAVVVWAFPAGMGLVELALAALLMLMSLPAPARAGSPKDTAAEAAAARAR
jgi:hypothetical protein